MTGPSERRAARLLVPVPEWPITAWSFVAYLLWLYCLPTSVGLHTRLGMWLLSWCGYWAYHPLHDGMSMSEIHAICDKRDATTPPACKRTGES